MLKFDSVTKAALKTATSQQDWATKLNAALGETRRILAIRDGTIFRNVGSFGPITLVGGKVTKFGKIKGTTVSLAADMSTGSSVIRIEGNGRWLEGTLGLSVAAQTAAGVTKNNIKTYDFVVDRNFTTTNGFGMTSAFSMAAFKFLKTGVGPATASYGKSAPSSFELWNWVNPAAPFLVGKMTLNKRVDDFVFEDAELALSNGDVAVYQSSESILHGKHEFGASLFVSHESNTVVGNVPLYQVLVSCVHRGTWTTYPSSNTYDFANHSVNPLPFKIIMKDFDGNVLHTFQQQDGLPINSKELHQSGYDPVKPCRPRWNCAMMLPWWNTRPRMADKAKKYYPGIAANDRRRSMGTSYLTHISVEPIITGGYPKNSQNSLGNIMATSKWPQPYKPFQPSVKDPYIQNDNQFNRSGSSSQYAPWIMGWGYEPGAFGCHNWYTAPGGPRFDRSPIPTVLAQWITNPNGNRPQEATPWRDMADAWLLNYFNHSNHWVKDPRTLAAPGTNAEYVEGKWYFKGYFYENGSDQIGPYNILINASQRGGTGPSHYDANGEMPYNGWGRDPLHAYGNAGWGALLMNSPMHAIGSKFDFITITMMNGTPDADARGENGSYYMVRTMAWDWLNHIIAWKLGSKHQLGFSRTEIEDRLSRLMLSIYRDIYLPTYVTMEDSVYCQSLRRLGTPMARNDRNDGWGTPGGGLGFYMGQTLQLMKQTGLWAVMMNKGGHCKIVLEMLMGHMDLYCFDAILDTNYSVGSYQGYPDGQDHPLNWADWSARFENHGGATMEKFADGTFRNDQDPGCWPFRQWPYIRRDFFPEYPHPRLSAAIAKYDAYAAERATYVASKESTGGAEAAIGADYTYKYPSLCAIAPPATGDLGPAQ